MQLQLGTGLRLGMLYRQLDFNTKKILKLSGRTSFKLHFWLLDNTQLEILTLYCRKIEILKIIGEFFAHYGKQ